MREIILNYCNYYFHSSKVTILDLNQNKGLDLFIKTKVDIFNCYYINNNRLYEKELKLFDLTETMFEYLIQSSYNHYVINNDNLINHLNKSNLYHNQLLTKELDSCNYFHYFKIYNDDSLDYLVEIKSNEASIEVNPTIFKKMMNDYYLSIYNDYLNQIRKYCEEYSFYYYIKSPDDNIKYFNYNPDNNHSKVIKEIKILDSTVYFVKLYQDIIYPIENYHNNKDQILIKTNNLIDNELIKLNIIDFKKYYSNCYFYQIPSIRLNYLKNIDGEIIKETDLPRNLNLSDLGKYFEEYSVFDKKLFNKYLDEIEYLNNPSNTIKYKKYSLDKTNEVFIDYEIVKYASLSKFNLTKLDLKIAKEIIKLNADYLALSASYLLCLTCKELNKVAGKKIVIKNIFDYKARINELITKLRTNNNQIYLDINNINIFSIEDIYSLIDGVYLNLSNDILINLKIVDYLTTFNLNILYTSKEQLTLINGYCLKEE